MTKQIQVFKNKGLNLDVRTIQNEDGSISINAEDTARGFGWVDNSQRATCGSQLSKVRWARMNKYIAELGSYPQVGTNDYIPESLFYLLGMKANNKVAQEFQKWLAVEVIPSIRKTGSYETTKSKIDKALKEKEIEARYNNSLVRKANLLLKLAKDNPLITDEYVQVLQSKATEIITGELILPLPEVERKTYSATELGKMLGISANKVGSLANKHNLKTDEYGKLFHDKSKYSNKEVETFRYYDNVIPLLKELV